MDCILAFLFFVVALPSGVYAQDTCADATFQNTYFIYVVSAEVKPTGDEKTVVQGCRWAWHFEGGNPFVPDFTMAQKTFHCVDGVWDSPPYEKCLMLYSDILEVRNSGVPYRNITRWEGETLVLPFYINKLMWIADGPWVFNAAGDVPAHSTMSKIKRFPEDKLSLQSKFTIHLTKEHTGYYYYKDVENYYSPTKKILQRPRHEWFYIEVLSPIDGEWGDWTSWTECTATCGESTRYRDHACDNPSPMYGGDDCQGPANVTEACSLDPCPIHGGWSEFGEWGDCSDTCGGGVTTHSRLCNNPVPEWGGDDCVGDATEDGECNTNLCPIDGNWATWEAWSTCTHSCGGGTRDHSRTCTDPAPGYGGVDCDGVNFEVGVCGEIECKADGNWAQWTEWTPCSKSCGFGNRTRERSCSDPAPSHGGLDCPGVGMVDNYFQKEDCMEVYDCPVDGNWTSWTPWGNCTLHCGGGEIIRSRECTNPPPDFGGRYCEGNGTEVIPNCNPEECGVNGGWTEWTLWTTCTKTCGSGSTMRNRTCTNPSTTYGGMDCKGTGDELILCNTNRCLDGAWTPWSPWSVCSKSCRGGVQARARSCTNPRPGLGGSDCPDTDQASSYSQWQRCNEQPCPVHGLWSSWSAWSECPVTCGGGYRIIERNCSQPEPQWGGKQCRGTGGRTWRCNTKACPLFGAPEFVNYFPSETTINVTWSVPLEYEWPILYYNVHYRLRLTANESPSTILKYPSEESPYIIYNLTSFKTLPTKDNTTLSMTVRGLPAYTNYELCLTAKHGHGAAMSGHSEVNKVRTLRHAFPAPPSPVTIEYADYAMEHEYKVLIRWSEALLPSFTAPTMYHVMIRDIRTTIDKPWTVLDEVPSQITGHLVRESSTYNLHDNVYIVQVVASNPYGSSTPAVCKELVDYLAVEAEE
ncbi:uncharacterized protein LOC117288968 [Asterias rubens]|uniref:uncharacterized protein LOC117288968 n=1 Tax=Asterias rubens TaxID=7604 RepID=UPI001454E7B3|nr:uncharacterized protein LOC117288968 [Asterias rubens]